MNASTLRRLAADQAALRTATLPPNYFFHPSEADAELPDDLTQLMIYLAGPQSTPYSKGSWKLQLKIPTDYPKHPPKACFRTRIWHPNVEENTGSVCVDTLKKDWDPKLTLKDVLMTISCLLIYPNPDSALNATAGQLLQENYEAFAHQAKLMTSIHARTPAEIASAATTARLRGEESSRSSIGSVEKQSTRTSKPSRLPNLATTQAHPRIDSTRSAPAAAGSDISHAEPDDENDEATASKENDPSLSPHPIPTKVPRRPGLAKRPLSDLPCPSEDDGQPMMSPSERNILNNEVDGNAKTETHQPHPGDQLMENNQLVNCKSSDVRRSEEGILREPLDKEDRPAKRICSDEAKENMGESTISGSILKPVRLSTSAPKVGLATRKASAPAVMGGASVKSGKARVGLRRL